VVPGTANRASRASIQQLDPDTIVDLSWKFRNASYLTISLYFEIVTSKP